MRFLTQFDKNRVRPKGETNTEKSMTIPDMNLSIRELLLNHSRGMSSNVKHYEGEYFEDIEIPQFNDPVDKMEYYENLLAQEAEVENQIKADREAARLKAIAKAQKAEKPPQKPAEPPTEE